MQGSRRIFESTVALELTPYNIESNLSQPIKKFIDLTLNHNSRILSRYDKETQQFHVLYLLAKALLNYNSAVLNLNQNEFYEKIYYPNLINTISIHFETCKKTINNLIRNVFKEVEDESKNAIDFYLVFYNSEPSIIQNDVIGIFLKGMFLDMDPLEVKDLRNYYLSVFRYLFFSYLKNRTTGLLNNDEVDLSFLTEENALMVSSRYRIYENAVRLSQVQELCLGSDSLNTISKNYDGLKNQVITNELQKLYQCIVVKDPTQDKKSLALKSNIESYNLLQIKSKFPIIYKLLRSVQVHSQNDSSFSEQDKVLIYSTVYNVVYSKFKKKLDRPKAQYFATNISKNLTASLVGGRFIDPHNLENVSLKGHTFVTQLKSFLNIILESI